jgi:PAS domain S-box-containing protein
MEPKQKIKENFSRRIMRDMSDGVLMISNSGEISFASDATTAVLGKSKEELACANFANAFIGDERNDAFVQVVVGALHSGEKTSGAVVRYYADPASENAKHLELAASIVYDEESKNKDGIVCVIRDVTALVNAEESKREGTLLFTVGIGAICVYLAAWEVISLVFDAPRWIMVSFMELTALVMFFVAIKFTSLRPSQTGLTAPRKEIVTAVVRGAIIAAVIFLLLFFARLYVWNFMPDGKTFPFFDPRFETNLTQRMYFLIAPLQEFLAKGVVLTSLLLIYGRAKPLLPIVVSSLIFAAMHVSYGPHMMLFTFVLCFATGYLYLKDENIWGCAVIHFVLGFFSVAFGFG